MKKLILKMFVVVLALAAFNTLMSCSSKDDEDSIAGTWGISSDAVMNGSNWGRARSYAGMSQSISFINSMKTAQWTISPSQE